TRFASFYFKEDVSSLEQFPDEVFKRILELMRQPAFQKLEDSHHLLMIFEYDWGKLTEVQKDELLIAIEKTYDKFEDWMSCFVFSELLGEYYCNDASLQVLCNLKATSNEIARSLVPHGLEHIVKESQEEKLRQRAMSGLVSMKVDPSSEVRREVEDALHKLSA
ncbi:MAG: hypothetical protein ACRD5H_15830, partial [Nitrososphaerales archaeon]